MKSQDLTMINPIVSGFSPDPSACLIGDTFFLVTSSFHLFPGLPIYASKDLLSWKHIGNAINNQKQLSLRDSDTDLGTTASSTIATGGLYAPTIRHNNGTTYIICTNVIHTEGRGKSRTDNFIIFTSDIWSNEWSNPVYFDFHGIDPSLFFDDDGKVYVQGCHHPEGHIWNFEIDIQTGEILTEPEVIWTGWDKRWTEAPHVYKKDGYYYLLAAEGGTFSDHMLSMARSRNINGPYQSFAKNPLWTAAGTEDYIQHTGHGEFFQDKQGEWWVVLLGVRMNEGRYILGRETFLVKLDWPVDEWPVIKSLSLDMLDEVLPSVSLVLPDVAEDDGWVFLRDPDLTKYEFKGTKVRIMPQETTLAGHKDSPSFVGKRQRALSGVSSVMIRISENPDCNSCKAGISFYKDEARFLEFGFNFKTRQVYFSGVNRSKGYTKEAEVSVSPREFVHFRIQHSELELSFAYKVDQEGNWDPIAKVDTLLMTGRDFIGPIVGLYAIGGETSCDTAITFETFKCT